MTVPDTLPIAEAVELVKKQTAGVVKTSVTSN